MSTDPALRDEALASWARAEASIDRAGMRSRIAGFPADIGEATHRALGFASSLSTSTRGPIVIAGMGGSAIAGDLVAAATRDRRTRPMAVLRSYDLPAWMSAGTTMIVSSYSGETEETIACYAAAIDRGLDAIVVTTGGEIGRMAGERGDPVFSLPTGYPPRAALGHSLPAVASIVAMLDPGLDLEADLRSLADAGEAIATLSETWLGWSPDNPVMGIAHAVAEGIALVYGGHPISIAVAERWKAQLNENAKRPAFAGALPEQNHNEIVGFESDGATTDPFVVIQLETAWDHPRVTRRFDVLDRLLSGRVRARFGVMAPESAPSEAMLWLCHFGDCASFVASIIGGQDPTPVVSIDALKNELKG